MNDSLALSSLVNNPSFEDLFYIDELSKSLIFAQIILSEDYII